MSARYRNGISKKEQTELTGIPCFVRREKKRSIDSYRRRNFFTIPLRAGKARNGATKWRLRTTGDAMRKRKSDTCGVDCPCVRTASVWNPNILHIVKFFQEPIRSYDFKRIGYLFSIGTSFVGSFFSKIAERTIAK